MKRRLPSVAAFLALVLGAPLALAADGVEKPKDGPRARWHPQYAAEIDVHGSIAAFDKYFVGLGGGARVTWPIWEHAPFTRIDDTLGFGVGLDVIRYGAYHPNGQQKPPIVSTVAYYVPIYAQWNVWLGSRASIFLEPTLLYRFASYADSCTGLPCAKANTWMPTASAGIRFRIVDHASINVRVGWPMVSVGGSWI
jgi:hypothetical protein